MSASRTTASTDHRIRGQKKGPGAGNAGTDNHRKGPLHMVTTSQIQLPTRGQDTPTVDTVTLIAIRRSIEPNQNWWQFAIRPWHLAVAGVSYLTVVGVGIAAIAIAGGIR